MIFSNKILQKLTSYHQIYGMLYSVSDFYVTDNYCGINVPTGMVTIKNGRVIFAINPQWMNSLTEDDLITVICHECMHLIFRHCEMNVEYHYIANLVKDCVINKYLQDMYDMSFDFSPNCSMFHRFKELEGAEPNRNWKYYYDYFLEHADNLEQYKDWQQLFQHITNRDDVQDILDKITANVSSEDVKQLLPGTENDFVTVARTHGQEKKYKSYESSIVNQCSNMLKTIYHKHKWGVRDRRFMSLDTRCILPSYEVEIKKPLLLFFMDVSGSCHAVVSEFYQILKGFSNEYFEIIPHVFDTEVKKIGLYDDQLVYGGGTCFRCIDEEIKKYPSDADVFVITDGMGTNISPARPEKWHLLLTANGKSNCFNNVKDVLIMNDIQC